MQHASKVLETPIYGLVDAAHYLRVPYNTLRYWTRGSELVSPIVHLAGDNPPRLSFVNLMECHIISAMRTRYDLRLPRVRRALETLAKLFPFRHPLLDAPLETDSVDVFIREHEAEIVNLSRGGQLGFRDILQMHLQRIERSADDMLIFFPFVEKRSPDEPKIITMSPVISFGRPVIYGTGIATAVIASRFHARESIGDLAIEYGRKDQEIEEAIRWESRTALAA